MFWAWQLVNHLANKFSEEGTVRGIRMKKRAGRAQSQGLGIIHKKGKVKLQ